MTTPRLQMDTRTRTVALSNLEAMCDRISGICHTYTVTKVSRSRVHVTYSNPDEYGTPNPVTAVYPCYPSSDPETPTVVLDMLRTLGGTDSEDWQSFEQLQECPTLWRRPDGRWRSHADMIRDGSARPYDDGTL